MDIYKYSKSCSSLEFKLNQEYSMLNLVFVLNKEILQGPNQVTPDNTMVYKSQPLEDCPYVSFPIDDTNFSGSSRSVYPRYEVIQLFKANYNYIIEYEVASYATLIMLSSDQRTGYRILDYRGRLIPDLHGPGKVEISGYIGLFVIKSDSNVTLRITPVENTGFRLFEKGPVRLCEPPYTLIGNYRKSSVNNLITFIPTDEFIGLYNLIRGWYYADPYFPCVTSSEQTIVPPYNNLSYTDIIQGYPTYVDTNYYGLNDIGIFDDEGNSIIEFKYQRQVSSMYSNLVLFETVNPVIPGVYTNIYLCQSRYSDFKAHRVSAYGVKFNIKLIIIDGVDAGDISIAIGSNNLNTWDYALSCNTGSAINVPFVRNGNIYTLSYDDVIYYEYNYNVIYFQLLANRDYIGGMAPLDESKPLIQLSSELDNPCLNR